MKRRELLDYIERTLEQFEENYDSGRWDARVFSVEGQYVLVDDDNARVACDRIKQWFSKKDLYATFELCLDSVPQGKTIHIGTFLDLCESLNVEFVRIKIHYTPEFEFTGLGETKKRRSNVRSVFISSWQEKSLIELLDSMTEWQQLRRISIHQGANPSYSTLYLALIQFLASKPNLKTFELFQHVEIGELAFDHDLEKMQQLLEDAIPEFYEALSSLDLECLSLKLPIITRKVQQLTEEVVSKLPSLKELLLDFWGQISPFTSVQFPPLPNLEKLSLKGLHEEIEPNEYRLFPKLRELLTAVEKCGAWRRESAALGLIKCEGNDCPVRGLG